MPKKKKKVTKVGLGHIEYSGHGIHDTKVDKEKARRKRKQDLRKKVDRKEYEDV
jgi:hypothetical protein